MTYDSLYGLLRLRRSPYAFDRAAPVTDADLARLFEAARWAPSSYNEQPWRFVVGREGDAAYQSILDALKGRNPEWALTAPVLGLALVAEAFARNGETNAHARHDLGMATMAFALAAATLGLGVHLMAGVDARAAAAALGVPDVCDPVTAFALGVPAPDPEAVVPEDLARRATTPKGRRPLGQTVFGPTWGSPFFPASDADAPLSE